MDRTVQIVKYNVIFYREEQVHLSGKKSVKPGSAATVLSLLSGYTFHTITTASGQSGAWL